MSIQHTELAGGRWHTFSLEEQMANIGSEVERALKWHEKGNAEYSKLAVYRALELVDFTIDDPRLRYRLKEICRMREFLVDYFLYSNEYNSTAESWRKYFNQWTFAARRHR